MCTRITTHIFLLLQLIMMLSWVSSYAWIISFNPTQFWISNCPNCFEKSCAWFAGMNSLITTHFLKAWVFFFLSFLFLFPTLERCLFLHSSLHYVWFLFLSIFSVFFSPFVTLSFWVLDNRWMKEKLMILVAIFLQFGAQVSLESNPPHPTPPPPVLSCWKPSSSPVLWLHKNWNMQIQLSLSAFTWATLQARLLIMIELVEYTGEVPSSIPNLDDCNHEDNPFATSSFANEADSIKGTLLVSQDSFAEAK